MSLHVRYGERTQTGYHSGSLSLDWAYFGDDLLREIVCTMESDIVFVLLWST